MNFSPRHNFHLNGLLLVLALAFLAQLPPLQAQDAIMGDELADDERLKLLTELNKVRGETASRASNLRRQQMDWLRDALSSDVKMVQAYEKAVRDVRFAGMRGESGEFKEWRDKNNEALKTPAKRAALRFHLRYLELSAKASGEEFKKNPPVAELAAYAKELDADTVADRKDELLSKGIFEGDIAKALGIRSPGGDWVDKAGDCDAMFNKLILPDWRAKKDPALLEWWMAAITAREKKAGAGNEHGRRQFMSRERPGMLWAYAKDLLVFGKQKSAAQVMAEAIRTGSDHPSFENWIGEFETFLKSGSSVAP